MKTRAPPDAPPRAALASTHGTAARAGFSRGVMSVANERMLQQLIGCTVDFEMKGCPHDEIHNRIHFAHTLDETGWIGVQEHAAHILGREFEFVDVLFAAEHGKSARIALEARLCTLHLGGHGTATAIRDGCADCYNSLRFETPHVPYEPDYNRKLKRANKLRDKLDAIVNEVCDSSDENSDADGDVAVPVSKRVCRGRGAHWGSE